jgi:hypothetical protein
MDFKAASRQIQEGIVSAYNDSCPLTVRRNNRNVLWCNRDLAEKSRNVRSLFNAAKTSENWIDYKRFQTDYNKALRQAKME